MADSSNNSPKVAEFKTLYRTIIQDPPTVLTKKTTSTHGYTPPEFPLTDIKSLRLVHDPEIPSCLIAGLERFAEGLSESDLKDPQLAEARAFISTARVSVARAELGTEVSVLQCFDKLVEPIRSLCLAVGLEVVYTGAPQFPNIIPDHSWTINKQPIAIFEHKSPAVAAHHFPDIVTLAKEGQTLDLSKSSENARSVISKLALASIGHDLEYCAVHCATRFIFMRIVRGRRDEPYQVRISDMIPLTSSGTPIISIILGLILHARKDKPLKYRAAEIQVPSTDNVSSEQGTSGSRPDSSAPGPYTPPNQQGGASPSNPPANSQMPPLRTLTASEYWEPRELSEGALAGLLGTMHGISLYWDMWPFSKTIHRLLRWKDSSIWNDSSQAIPRMWRDSLIWNDSSQVEAIPRIIPHSSRDCHTTPPPSPPMVPFVLRLNSTVGQGAVGSVYRGSFHDLSLPIVVKVLPAETMGHELDIWRRLRGLAGI
ncbi:hypothetical protein FRC01_005763, partial [Tulasnella sp. 417]